MIPIKHNRVSLNQVEKEACLRVLEKGIWSQNTEVINLEDRLQKRTGQNHVLAVNNGLNAIIIALKTLGIGMGDKVMIPAYSCVALANAVLACGAKYICVDVEKETGNIDYGDATLKFTKRVKAIIVVNLFGIPANFGKFALFGVPLIEDCAHGFGLSLNQGIMGSQSEISIFSFYSTKFIGFGEGGAIGFRNKDQYKRALDMRDYTDKVPSAIRMNYKMTDIIAVVLKNKLDFLDDTISKRKSIAAFYRDFLDKKNLGFAMDLCPNMNSRIWYRFVIKLKSKTMNSFIKEMKISGVEVAKPVEDWRSREEKKTAPNASDLYQMNVSLPIYPDLNNSDQKKVIDSIIKIKSFE